MIDLVLATYRLNMRGIVYYLYSGYVLNTNRMVYMSPLRNTLSNIIEESSVASMLDLRRELAMGANIIYVK